MALRTQVCSVSDLSSMQVREMLALMAEYYDNVQPDVFREDLQEKQNIILLRRQSGALAGFSTQKIFMHAFGGQDYRVVFSGDTIVDPACWGRVDFPMALLRWMLEVWREDRSRPLLWMLICKGMRVYRLLPLFFKTFYPSCEYATPPQVRQLMHDLGRIRYPGRYRPESGLVKTARESNHLNAHLALIPEHRRKERHIAFFCQKNPNYAAGDELLCLARIEPQNIKSSILNRLGR
ncbi:MAG: hypothetical protein GY868_14195 [Deltaproteobacteria bacterium]|nr:hypothetical protein [Deltaproteobacteria bacterium]